MELFKDCNTTEKKLKTIYNELEDFKRTSYKALGLPLHIVLFIFGVISYIIFFDNIGLSAFFVLLFVSLAIFTWTDKRRIKKLNIRSEKDMKELIRRYNNFQRGKRINKCINYELYRKLKKKDYIVVSGEKEAVYKLPAVFEYSYNKIYKVFAKVDEMTVIKLQEGEKFENGFCEDSKKCRVDSISVNDKEILVIIPLYENITTDVTIITNKCAYLLNIESSNDKYNLYVKWDYLDKKRRWEVYLWEVVEGRYGWMRK